MKLSFPLISRSTGDCAGRLLNGVLQKGKLNDNAKEILEQNSSSERLDLDLIRDYASKNIEQLQECNKKIYDKKHKPAKKYNVGDYVVIVNTDVTANLNKKLIPKYRDPYVIKRVLLNDKYIVNDIDGFQVT